MCKSFISYTQFPWKFSMSTIVVWVANYIAKHIYVCISHYIIPAAARRWQDLAEQYQPSIETCGTLTLPNFCAWQRKSLGPYTGTTIPKRKETIYLPIQRRTHTFPTVRGVSSDIFLARNIQILTACITYPHYLATELYYRVLFKINY